MKKIWIIYLFILLSCVPSSNSEKICDQKSKGFLLATIFYAQNNQAYCYTNVSQRNNSQNPITLTPNPITFTYTRTTNVFLDNIPINTQTPTTTGTITAYSVSPALPSGLSINATTGVISGTAPNASPETNYTFTANGPNNATATFQMKIRVGTTTAIRVYGQPNFIVNVDNNGGLSATSLSTTTGVTGDSAGGILIGDTGNIRYLYYPKGTTTATRIYGQYNNFACSTTNNNGSCGASTPNANNLFSVRNGFFGLNNILYLADTLNHRVLRFSGISTTATGVFGQANLTSAMLTMTADGLREPEDIVQDTTGGIYIADRGNNRVLYYAAGSTTATRVYGQFGNFTCVVSNSANNNGACTATPRPISANSLSSPLALALDSLGGLFIVDFSNSRVLHYPKDITTADRVYGQLGSFTTNAVPAANANSLNQPAGIAVDAFDNVYISDTFNHRILFYQGTSTTATRVYGQRGSFTCAFLDIDPSSCSTDTISAFGLNGPARIYIDPDGSLFATDENNRRVLMY
jgi:hypothetical protein